MVNRIELGRALNLETDFIPESNSNRPGTRLNTEYITIHNTDNTSRGAGALAHARYMKGADARSRRVSWHYTVDDNLCVKHLPLNEIGWHAGSTEGNKKSIGIEICMNEGIDQLAANEKAATLTAILLYDLNIPINNVVPHYHWSRKNCPRLLLDSGRPGEKWGNFIEKVNRIYENIEPQEEIIRKLFLDKNEFNEGQLSSEWLDTHGVEETVDNETPIEFEDINCEAPLDSEEALSKENFEAGPFPKVNVQLPSSGQGFYSYSIHRYKQYGLAKTIQAIETIARNWFSNHRGGPVIGIGNISRNGGGPMPPHSSHQKGLDVDFRLLRNDGARVGVSYTDSSYSRPRTQKLVETIKANSVLGVELILFNDPHVTGVRPYPGHNDHLHVRFRQPSLEQKHGEVNATYKIIEGPVPVWKGNIETSPVTVKSLNDTASKSQNQGFTTVNEKIIGTNNLRAVHVLEKAIQLSKAVAHITLNGGAATGFMISPNVLITNNHVFGSEDDARSAVIRFNYQLDRSGNQLPTDAYECDPDSLFYTNPTLDYSVVRVKGEPGLKWGFINMSESANINVSDDIFIIQHPGGEPKQVALSDNVVAYVNSSILQYLTDTLPGSSGSPVFNDSFNLVALHHSGGWLPEPDTNSTHYRNEGIRISAILNDMPNIN